MASILARWNAISKRTQLIAVVGFAVVIIASLVLAYSLRDTKTALSSKPWTVDQVAEVDKQLSAWSVPHATVLDNVRVDGGQRNDILLRLALAGVPHDTLTSATDMMKDVGALTPQPVLEDMRQHANENELAAQLRAISGIANAKVIVAPGIKSFFADEKSSDASANVMLTMDPGASLTTDKVDAIKRYVASGVSGLDPERVAVIDDRGVSPGSVGADMAGLARTKQMQAQSQLDTVLGVGLTNVRVNVDLDVATHATYSYDRLPAGVAAISGNHLVEKLNGKDRSYLKDRSSVDRGVRGKASEIRTGPGQIAHLSVAVAVDERIANESQRIRDLVAATVGIDPARGDVLAVTALPFRQQANVAGLVRGENAGILSRALPAGIIGLTIIGVMLIVTQPMLAMIRRKENAAILREARTLEPATDVPRIWQTLAGEPPHIAAAVISQLPTQTAVAVLDMYDERERRAISERLSRPVAPLLSQIAPMPASHG